MAVRTSAHLVALLQPLKLSSASLDTGREKPPLGRAFRRSEQVIARDRDSVAERGLVTRLLGTGHDSASEGFCSCRAAALVTSTNPRDGSGKAGFSETRATRRSCVLSACSWQAQRTPTVGLESGHDSKEPPCLPARPCPHRNSFKQTRHCVKSLRCSHCGVRPVAPVSWEYVSFYV
jgi:hypothetical protein